MHKNNGASAYVSRPTYKPAIMIVVLVILWLALFARYEMLRAEKAEATNRTYLITSVILWVRRSRPLVGSLLLMEPYRDTA